jgi:hypothetical protein
MQIGQTPVNILCRRWNSRVLQDISLYCKDFKLEINVVDHHGSAPLHLVVSNIKEALTQREVHAFLLDNIFIDTKHRNSNRYRPLDIVYHKLHQLICNSIREQCIIIISELKKFELKRKQLSFYYITNFLIKF